MNDKLRTNSNPKTITAALVNEDVGLSKTIDSFKDFFISINTKYFSTYT